MVADFQFQSRYTARWWDIPSTAFKRTSALIVLSNAPSQPISGKILFQFSQLSNSLNTPSEWLNEIFVTITHSESEKDFSLTAWKKTPFDTRWIVFAMIQGMHININSSHGNANTRRWSLSRRVGLISPSSISIFRIRLLLFAPFFFFAMDTVTFQFPVLMVPPSTPFIFRLRPPVSLLTGVRPLCSARPTLRQLHELRYDFQTRSRSRSRSLDL